MENFKHIKVEMIPVLMHPPPSLTGTQGEYCSTDTPIHLSSLFPHPCILYVLKQIPHLTSFIP